MLVIPAVDILGGNCVQLIGGDTRRKRMEVCDPVKVAKDLVDLGAKYIHLIDLDCALDRGGNLDLVLRMIKEIEIPIQVGGGIRTHDKIDRFLDQGAGRVIVGTHAIMDTDWLEKMCSIHPKKLLVALDTRGKEIVVKGWQAGSGKDLIDYATRVDDLKIAGFLFTNVVLEGRLIGTDIKIVKELLDAINKPVIAAGGITNMKDLERLEKVGVSAAVVGSAIYEGTLDLKEAVERFH